MTIILDNGKRFNLIKWEDDPTTSNIHVYFDPIIGCNDTIKTRGYLVFSPYMYSVYYVHLNYVHLNYAPSLFAQVRSKILPVYMGCTETTWKLRWKELSLTEKELLIVSFLAYHCSGLCTPEYSGFYACANECIKYLADVQLIDNKETTKMTDNTALLDKLLQPTGEEEATDYCDEHVYMFDCDPDSDEDEYEPECYELDSDYIYKMEQIYRWASECDDWFRGENRRYSVGDVHSIEHQIDDMYDTMNSLHSCASDYVE